MSAPSKGKGKARARPPLEPEDDETATLLATSSAVNLPPPDIMNPRRRPHSNLCNHLTTFLIIILSVLVAASLFLALLIFTYKPSSLELNALSKTAFRYTLPESVNVVEVGDNGVWLNVTVRCGIDYDMLMGIRSVGDFTTAERQEAEMRGERGLSAEWWEGMRRWSAYKVWEWLDLRSVEVETRGDITISRATSEPTQLISATLQEPVRIPLIPRLSTKDSHIGDLVPVSFQVFAKPVASTGDLWEFAQHAWAEGAVNVTVGVHKVLGRIPSLVWTGDVSVYRQSLNINIPVPELPGLPKPGKPLNLSDLVHLQSYSFSNPSPESDSSSLYITALASLPNPLQNISTNASIPFGLPFTISLQDGSQMAQVITQPLNLGRQSTFNMNITGQVSSHLGIGEDGNTTGLSSFLQNYLHGIDNPITITGLSKLPSFAPSDQPHTPSWLLSTLPTLSLSLSFPAPKPPPIIIREVTIEHMRLTESGGKMRASGTVIVNISLPPGLEGMNIDVKEIKPDILIYDGPASADPPDASNPPVKSFGHINPEEYIDAETTQDGEEVGRMIVRAPLKDVEVVILKGRDKVLSDFVGKVVFRGGALAGIKGTAAVRVEIGGTEGRVGLDGLPVEGEVWVGKQRFMDVAHLSSGSSGAGDL